jgi:RNA polymerase sigma factor (sigma-70 family)
MSAVGDVTSEAVLRAERARLVRLCYRFTGNLDAAEDLAQETLYEAQRNFHKLHDPTGYGKWLSAIARNVCLRWNERRGREAARLLPHRAPNDEDVDQLDLPDPDYDLDVELDRRELVTLLDHALALLPVESRQLLIERYVEGSPYAEIAARLGLNSATVAKRLERGRLRLKRVLATHLIHEAAAYGLADRLFDDWTETPICKPCVIPVNLYATIAMPPGIQGYRAAFERDMLRHGRRFGGGVAGLAERCWRCGRAIPYRPTTETSPGLPVMHYVRAWCDTCRDGGWNFGVSWQLLASSEGQRFRQEHPRFRFLPEREVEAGGVPAIVAGFASMTDSAELHAVFRRDSFECLRVHA